MIYKKAKQLKIGDVVTVKTTNTKITITNIYDGPMTKDGYERIIIEGTDENGTAIKEYHKNVL